MAEQSNKAQSAFTVPCDAADVIRGLSYQYNAVFFIDLARGIITPYAAQSDVAREMLPTIQANADCTTILREFAERYVVPDERDVYLNAVSLETVVRELGSKQRYAHFVNRLNTEGHVELVEMAFNRVDDDDHPTRAVMTHRTLKKRASNNNFDPRCLL